MGVVGVGVRVEVGGGARVCWVLLGRKEGVVFSNSNDLLLLPLLLLMEFLLQAALGPALGLGDRRAL